MQHCVRRSVYRPGATLSHGIVRKTQGTNSNGNVVILANFWSLATLDVVSLTTYSTATISLCMTWKHVLNYWPFVKNSHRSPEDSPHKGPVMKGFDVFCVISWTNNWTNSRVGGDLRRHGAHVASRPYHMTLRWHGSRRHHESFTNLNWHSSCLWVYLIVWNKSL